MVSGNKADVPPYRIKGVTIDFSQWKGLDLSTGKAIEFPEGLEKVDVVVK